MKLNYPELKDVHTQIPKHVNKYTLLESLVNYYRGKDPDALMQDHLIIEKEILKNKKAIERYNYIEELLHNGVVNIYHASLLFDCVNNKKPFPEWLKETIKKYNNTKWEYCLPQPPKHIYVAYEFHRKYKAK